MKKLIFTFVFCVTFLLTCIFSNTKLYAYESNNDFFRHPSEAFLNNELELTFQYNTNNYNVNIDYNYYLFDEGLYDYYLADSLVNPRQKTVDIVKIEIKMNPVVFSVYLHIDEFDDMILVEIEGASLNSYSLQLCGTATGDCFERVIKTNSIVFEYITSNKNIPHREVFQEKRTISTMAIDFGDLGGGGSGDSEVYAESLASKDSILDNYSPLDKTHLSPDGKLKDDDVVKLIPKKTFNKEGNYYFIGKEFGYFVTTVEIDDDEYHSIVFLFDIEIKMPGISQPTSTASICILPKFQYEYQYLPSHYFSTDTLYPGCAGIVAPYSSLSGYYLKNVNFTFAVENKNALNVGQGGYNAYEDNGDYIFQTRYGFIGEGKNIARENFLLETVSFGIGFVPLVGDLLAIYDYSENLFENAEDFLDKGFTEEKGIVSANYEAYIATKYQYASQQIENYGGLLKAVTISPDDQKGVVIDPLLIGTRSGNDFAKGTVELIAKGDVDTNEEQRLYLGMDMDLVKDNTTFKVFNWFPSGSVDIINIAHSLKNYGTYSRR